jgi:hypothetical protein
MCRPVAACLQLPAVAAQLAGTPFTQRPHSACSCCPQGSPPQALAGVAGEAGAKIAKEVACRQAGRQWQQVAAASQLAVE